MGSHKANILIVDDDPTSLFLLETILAPLKNVLLVKADSGEAAIDRLEETEFALAILDISMHGMSGFDVAKRMASMEQNRETPILFLTAIHKTERDILDGYKVGAVDYMFKPFDRDILLSKVRIFVELDRKRRALERSDQKLRRKTRELEEREQRWRGLLQSIQAGVIVCAPDTNIIASNATAGKLLGLTGEQMEGKMAADSAWVFLRADGTRMPLDEFPVNRVLRSRETLSDFTLGVSAPEKDHVTWLQVTASPIFSDTGELTEIIITFMDITERKKAEEELRYSRRLLQKTFESLNEGVFILADHTFEIIDCNHAAATMVGYGREELLGESVELVHVDAQSHAWFREQARLAIMEKGYFQLPRYHLKRKSGETFSSEHYITPIEREPGEPLFLVSVIRDITEKIQAEEQLKQRAFELEVLHELSRKLGYTLDYEDLVKLMIENLGGVLEFDVAAGLFMKKNEGVLYNYFNRPLSPELQQNILDTMRMENSRLTGNNSVESFSEHTTLACRTSGQGGDIQRIETAVMVPLFETNGEIAGMLYVGAASPDAFSVNQLELLHKVTEQASSSVGRLRALVKESRKELEQLVHTMPAGVVLLDQNNTVVLANPVGRAMLAHLVGVHEGETLHHLNGIGIETLLTDLHEHEEHHLQLIHDGPPPRVFRVTGRQLNAGPQAGGHVLILLDVTREHEDAERIKTSERRFRTLFDNSSDAIFVHDLEGRFLDVNSVACQRLEYTREQLLTMTPDDLAPGNPSGEKSIHERISEILENRGFTFFETVQQRKSGGLVPTEINAKLIEYEGRKAVLTTARNITERKQAERERIEHEAMLDAILSGIKAAFFIINPRTMRVVETNEQAAALLGQDRENLIDRLCQDILSFSICNHDACGDCLHIDHTFLGKEATLTLPDKTLLPISLNRLRVLKGGQEYMAIIIFDISERKALERQLALAQKLESIGQLAAGIAHEINTPIQYVSTNIDFFQTSFEKLRVLLEKYNALYRAAGEDRDTGSLVLDVAAALKTAKLDFLLREIPQAIDDSLDGVRRVTTIVQAIKKFSHPDIGEMTPLEINEAIKNTVAVARNEWKYDSEVRTDLAGDLPLIHCVPGEFNQAVLNVLVNAAHANSAAVKARGGKGIISISTARSGDFVEIRISDTGTGIPPEHRNRIFDPFFTTKEVGKGTGQGLVITHAIMDKHGGTIDFETEMDKGTTFILRFPVDPPRTKGNGSA
ncbi:PAS domain S-box protein [Desulfonatronum lacustre]|uniref:PAS domain S-box protein n=1 Tax=Desulfonatronum lacustre TaxID=66849 RepID=UPI0004B7DD9C|nr:PAS domain S-box protein [Desulfonatronum lacustre]